LGVPLTHYSSFFTSHCERSEAISKGIPTIQYEIASGFAHRNDVDCFALPKKGLAMTLSTEGEAVPALPPSASLTHSTNFVGGYSH